MTTWYNGMVAGCGVHPEISVMVCSGAPSSLPSSLRVHFLAKQRSDPLALRNAGSDPRSSTCCRKALLTGEKDSDQWHRRLM